MMQSKEKLQNFSNNKKMEEEEILKTPFWDLSDWQDEVYEPREDSFLLLDALEQDLALIRQFNPDHVLEIGSGSGIIITALACAIKHANCIAVDINPHACVATQKTAEFNGVSVNVIQSNLVEGIALKQNIGLLVFNPPYVPSLEGEEKGIIDKAWAGSARGRSTVDRLFPQLPDLMSQNCLGYIVALEENDPREMCCILEQLGFVAVIVMTRNIFGERLSVIRFLRFS